jgi:hypothetical protein
MNKKQIQLLSVMAIGKSKMSEQTKLQLLRFVKEATEVQLKSFLLDGEIVKLDSVSEQVVNDRFSSFMNEGFLKNANCYRLNKAIHSLNADIQSFKEGLKQCRKIKDPVKKQKCLTLMTTNRDALEGNKKKLKEKYKSQCSQ